MFWGCLDDVFGRVFGMFWQVASFWRKNVRFSQKSRLVNGKRLAQLASPDSRQTLENMRSVLSQLGATMDDVVKVTIFVTDISHFNEIHEVRREYFKKGNYPASTIVEINRLALEDLMIEIEAIAVV